MNCTNIHGVTNEKLLPFVYETEELMEKYAGIGTTWGLSHEYYALSGLKLFLAHTDTDLKFGFFEKDKEKRLDKITLAISMLESKTWDVIQELEIEKSRFFPFLNFFNVQSLRNKRDRYVKIVGLYRRVLSVVERL